MRCDAIIVALAAGTLALAGCGGGDGRSARSGPTDEQRVEDAVPDLLGVVTSGFSPENYCGSPKGEIDLSDIGIADGTANVYDCIGQVDCESGGEDAEYKCEVFDDTYGDGDGDRFWRRGCFAVAKGRVISVTAFEDRIRVFDPTYRQYLCGF